MLQRVASAEGTEFSASAAFCDESLASRGKAEETDSLIEPGKVLGGIDALKQSGYQIL